MESMLYGPPKNATEEELSDYLKQLCSDVTLQSRKDGFFAIWLDQVKSNLSGNFMQHFAKLTKDEDRIVYVWSITPLHTLKVQKFFKGKNADTSEQKRNDGNKAFQKNQYQAALSLYSQAVTKAPHHGQMLSYAYANRSAVLFHVKKYNLSLQDIGLALAHGYPVDLHYKILERRGSCYQRQGNYSEALTVFQQSLAALNKSKLDDGKLASWTKTLEGKMKECQDKPNEDLNPERGVRDPLVGGPAPRNKLFEGPSTTLPYASSAVGLASTPEMGRYTVAERDIPAGELVLSERPFASVLTPEKSGGHCLHCCYILTAPVACPGCSGGAFCSVECRDVAMSTYHKWECPFSDLLFASGMSLNCYLALRIITEKTAKYFKERKYDFEEPQEMPSASTPHRAEDYLSVYHLVTLANNRDSFDFLQRALMAVFLLKVLQRADYFGAWDDESNADADLKEEELLVGALLLRNLQVIQFNAHEISGFSYYGSMKNMPFKTSRTIYLGLALYPTVSFFNHSCLPAVTRYFNGREMNVVTIRPLKKGEIIAENYGPVFTHHPYQQRQKKLSSRYWFNCACEACNNSWPTYPDMKAPLTLKCSSCGNPLPTPSEDADKQGMCVLCPGCGKSENAAANMLKLMQAQKCYKEGKTLLDKGHREQAIVQLVHYLDVASQLIYLPNKEFHLAMEALRLLVCARGMSFAVENKKK